ncbi:MAG: PEP-CTERM sorting domain-containing protein [Bacteroidetes bacterium]|nr:MAG: PEP-CTERM sorting domain-containing protein [Bacteroidota bacterium]
MKTFKLFIALTLFLLASSSMLTAQVQTIHDPNVTPTITPEEINELGQQVKPKSDLIVLDFEGLANTQPILDYYNGGFAGGGIGPGPDYGVTFSGATLSIIAEYAGGTGNFQNEPSPSTIMFFLDEDNATMNVEAGFETGFSFYYSAINQPGSVEVYDEVGGEGNLLASLNLAPLGTLPIPGGIYNIWEPIGVSFDGVAKSVKFIGAADFIGFDDVTFGSEIPGGDDDDDDDEPAIPLSNWALLLGLGLILLFTMMRIKRIL